MLREIVEAQTVLNFQDMKREIVKLGWKDYKNKIPNKMHEFTNKKKILSMSVNDDGTVKNIRLRDFDIPNGVRIVPTISKKELIRKISSVEV